MFSFVSGDYYTIHPLLWDYYVRALDPHLLMLAFLSETGLIGTFGLVVLFANFFALALRNYRNAESEEDKADGLLILCSIFFVICSSCYAGSWFSGQNSYQFMMYLAACTAFYEKQRQNEPT